MRELTEKIEDMMTAFAKFTEEYETNHMVLVQDLKKLKEKIVS